MRTPPALPDTLRPSFPDRGIRPATGSDRTGRRAPALLGPALALLCAAAAPALECAAPRGGDALIRAGSILLLGELHGTAEAPAVVGELACAALQASLPVAVALEIPYAEQAGIDRFVAGETDRDALLAGPFWQRDYQDGRSSRAMADLLARLRALRREAPHLRVAAIDRPQPPAQRDAAMAARIDELAAATPEGLVISLTGNLHNRLTRGNRWNPDYLPMGYQLRQLRPAAPIRAIDLEHQGGTAWICQSSSAAECGERPLRGVEPREPGLQLYPPTADGPFTGALHLGPITASPPAVRPASR